MAWLGVLWLLAGGLMSVLALGMGRAAWVLLNPPRRGYAFALARGMPGAPDELGPAQGWTGNAPRWRAWELRHAGARMPVWEIDGARADGPVVILTHGWGESRVHSLPRVAAWNGAASRVIAWDLRGHGEASGRCALGTTEVEDLLALIDAVSARPETTTGGPTSGGARGVVLHGFSLGAGVSIAAAGRDGRVSAVIAEAPYRVPRTPAAAVMARAGIARGVVGRLVLSGALRAARWMLGSGLDDRAFDRARLAHGVRCPLLVLRGSLDDIVPRADAQAIAESCASGALVEVPGAGHVDLWTEARHRESAVAAIRALADGAGLGR
ncbi:MAG: alpha/beta hydrolase [Phycisphaerales bacterium]